MKRLKKIKGDASLRCFIRKTEKNFSSILVYAKKDKNKNLLIYDSINKILNKNKILAPLMYEENYKKSFIEIEDFGDKTIYKLLKKTNSKFNYFKKVIKLLKQIQSIKDKSIKNFKNKRYKIPIYKRKILIQEANLFYDWYVKKNLPKNKSQKFAKDFKKIITRLSSKLQLRNNVFVHRDFHVSNLMLVKDQIGIIDSQDALIGNKAYDLASLVDDVRIKTSKGLKNKIYNYYVKKFSETEKIKIKNDFEILSVLRNLKIIGIFTRLAVRDRKRSYLKLIPYTWSLIQMRLNQNIVFRDLSAILNKNFKEFIK